MTQRTHRRRTRPRLVRAMHEAIPELRDSKPGKVVRLDARRSGSGS
jgi:hypothetical protein